MPRGVGRARCLMPRGALLSHGHDSSVVKSRGVLVFMRSLPSHATAASSNRVVCWLHGHVLVGNRCPQATQCAMCELVARLGALSLTSFCVCGCVVWPTPGARRADEHGAVDTHGVSDDAGVGAAAAVVQDPTVRQDGQAGGDEHRAVDLLRPLRLLQPPRGCRADRAVRDDPLLLPGAQAQEVRRGGSRRSLVDSVL